MKEKKKQALAKHVKQKVSSGKKPGVLRRELQNKGWSEDEITAVFSAAGITQDESEKGRAESSADGGEQKQHETVDPFAGNAQTQTEPDEVNSGADESEMMEPPHPSYADTSSNHQQSNVEMQAQAQGSGNNNQQPANSTASDRFKAGTKSATSRSDSWSTTAVATVLVAFFVLIGVGGAAAYINFVGNSTAATPPNVKEVYTAHTMIDSLHYDASFDSKLSFNVEKLKQRDDFDKFKKALPYVPNTGNIGEVPKQLQLTFSVGGSADLSSTNAGGKTNIKLAFGGNKVKNVLDLRLRFVDQTGYLNPKNLPSVPMLPLRSFEQQWFSFTASSTPAQFMSLKQSVDDTSLSTTTITQILKAVHSSGLVSVDSMVQNTMADGTAAFKYTLYIHPRKFPAFKKKLKEIITRNRPELANRQEFQEAFEEMQPATSFPKQVGPVDVWLGQNSYRLRKVKFSKTYDNQDLQKIAQNNGGDNVSGFESATVSLNLDVFAYNQGVSVQKPASSTPIKKAFESLPFFTSGTSEARKSSRDARRQADLSQIRTGLALYRDEKGSYPVNLYEGSKSLASSGVMAQVPTDPADNSHYFYTTNTSADSFCLGAVLEDSTPIPENNSQQCIQDLQAAGAPDSINYAVSGG